MKRHNRDFNVECYLCKRLFILFHELRQHMRTHVSFDDQSIKILSYSVFFFIRLGRSLSNALMKNAVSVFRREPIGMHIFDSILDQLYDHTSARCALKRLPGPDYCRNITSKPMEKRYILRQLQRCSKPSESFNIKYRCLMLVLAIVSANSS